MKKRKDECLFCTSRRCYERVASSEDKGKTYDEIACIKHIENLYDDSDEKAPGIMKIFQSSTARQKRGDKEIFEPYEKRKKEEQNE